MILLADSGSTKTTWRILNGKNKKTVKTSGINPYYLSQSEIEDELQKNLIPLIKDPAEVSEIHFYGAGLGTETRRKEVLIPLHFLFRQASIEVEHDLTGAARALLGKKAGFACIAGTGSNSCFYDGEKVVQNIASLGLYLGDEGSGGYKGKLLITDYLRDRMPENIRKKFEDSFKDRLPDILEKVYKKPFPNRYLASFMPFIMDNKREAYIKELISKSFRDFFDNNLSLYPDWDKHKVGFVGSVAFLCSRYLKEVAKEKGFKVGTIISDPIDSLTDFHTL